MITTVVADCAALTNWNGILAELMEALGNRILAYWDSDDFLFRSNEKLFLGDEGFILRKGFTEIESPGILVGILAQQQQQRHGFIPNNMEETLRLAHGWFESLLCRHLKPYEQVLQPIRTLRRDEYKYNLALIVTPEQKKALADSELGRLFPGPDMIVVHEGVQAHQQVIESALERFGSKPQLTVAFCAAKKTAEAAVRAGIGEVIGYANGWSSQNFLQHQLQSAGVRTIAYDGGDLLSRMKVLGGYTPPQPYRS